MDVSASDRRIARNRRRAPTTTTPHFFFGVGARCGRSERRRFAAAGLGAAFFADAGFLTADLGFFADAGFFLAEALALRGVACRGVL